jgi:hypothetical protein
VGVDSALTAVLAAFGLSGAAGLNAWLPLFAAALADRLGLVELAAPFDELASTGGLVVLGVLMLADLVGDKIPGVDHVLHVLGLAVAPLSGAALFAGQTGDETDLPTLLAILLGGGTAGVVHAARAALRPASTASTAGLGNPVLSVGEDVGSLTLVVLAFAVPLLAVVLLALLVVPFVRWRRRRRRTRAPLARGPRDGSGRSR